MRKPLSLEGLKELHEPVILHFEGLAGWGGDIRHYAVFAGWHDNQIDVIDGATGISHRLRLPLLGAGLAAHFVVAARRSWSAASFALALLGGFAFVGALAMAMRFLRSNTAFLNRPYL